MYLLMLFRLYRQHALYTVFCIEPRINILVRGNSNETQTWEMYTLKKCKHDDDPRLDRRML